MRKISILLVAMMVLMGSGVEASPQVKQVSPAVYADIEMPFRCHPPQRDKQVSTTIVLEQDDFVFLPTSAGDMLPRYSVNGYSFRDKPVDEVLAGLLEMVGIKVMAPKGEFVALNGRDIRGELSTVVQQLADSADIFYSYKDSTKTLTISRRGEYTLSVPKNRVVLLAVLDALRGSQIADLVVDWEKYQITMNVSSDELQKAKKLVRQILDDSYMLAAEIQGYQVLPLNNAGWQGIINRFTGSLASIGRAVIGRSIVLSSQSMVDELLKVVGSSYQLTPIVAGEAVVPDGWQMRFNVNECSNYTLPYPDLSVVMKTKVKNNQQTRTKISLYTSMGAFTSFDVVSGLNQEVALVGIPARKGNAELMFLLRFNLIRFVQKGERK